MTTKAKDPWHKRYHGNALGGYVGLSLELRGAYTTILDLLYDSGWEEGLPDRERWFAGHMDISVGKWRKIRQALIDAGKIDVLENGYLSNARYRIERERSQILSEKRAESGQKGGEKRAKNAVKVTRNSHDSDEKSPDLLDRVEASASILPPSRARAESREAEAESEEEEEEEERESASTPESVAARAWDAIELADHLTRIAGVRHLEPQRIIDNQQQVREWIELGVSIPDIEAVIVKRRDKATSSIHALKYFDGAIRQHHARKEHPGNGSSSDGNAAPIRDELLARFLERGGTLGGYGDSRELPHASDAGGVGSRVARRRE